MQVRTAEFLTSASQPKQFLTRPIPHFVFAGRSNVGKSSILNRVLNRKGLAKTSSTPGKTRLVNYFLINDSFFFVDVPGYGYARVSKGEREKWSELIEAYFLKTPYIACVFQLVDIRHEATKDDVAMIEWLQEIGLTFRILLTKADKLSNNQVARQTFEIAKQLRVSPELLIATSAETSLGVPKIWTEINTRFEESKLRIQQEKDLI